MRHQQTWVKVNTQVDQGMAEIVSLLNEFQGVRTLESCQGDFDKAAYVCFQRDDWRETGQFLFDGLRNRLREAGADVRLSLESFGEGVLAKLEFGAEATPMVTSALRQMRQGRP